MGAARRGLGGRSRGSLPLAAEPDILGVARLFQVVLWRWQAALEVVTWVLIWFTELIVIYVLSGGPLNTVPLPSPCLFMEKAFTPRTERNWAASAPTRLGKVRCRGGKQWMPPAPPAEGSGVEAMRVVGWGRELSQGKHRKAALGDL